MDISSLLFSYEGRIGRMMYFWASFALLVVQVCFLALLIRRGIGLEHVLTPKGLGILAVYMLIFGWMNCALATKRFHDIGQSGWMTLVAFGGIGLPIVGFYSMWLLGALFFRAGDSWANAYGPPLGGGVSPAGGGLGGDAGEPYQAKAIAAIDELARSAAAGGSSAVALAAPGPTRVLPGAAPMAALPAPSSFGRRNAGFGKR